MKEDITLKSRGGATTDASAEVQRFSSAQRLSKALPVAVGGTVLGLCTIVIPGVHLISVWLIPLLSLGIAWYFYSRIGAVDSVTGPCPDCEAEMTAEGGPWEEPMWLRCSACNKPLEVRLSTPMD
jgi:hypothetical protein